jgi:DNA-binding NarL/FixJ family response regulator
MSKTINLIIADDHPIFRQGLRQLIEKEPGMKIEIDCGDGAEALEGIVNLRPEIAILDIDMPQMSGLQVLKELKDTDSATQVIFLTVHRSWESYDNAYGAGARGYVLKDSAVEDIVKAIRAVSRGEIYTSSVLNEYFLRKKKAVDNSVPVDIQQLTATERQILKLIGEYLTNKQIAETLNISPMTVKTHRRNISAKFQIEGNNKLIRLALEFKFTGAV